MPIFDVKRLLVAPFDVAAVDVDVDVDDDAVKEVASFGDDDEDDEDCRDPFATPLC